MIRQEGPGVDRDAGRGHQGRQAADAVRPVGVILEETPAVDSPHHYMVEEPVEDSGRSAEGIQTRLSGHGERSLPQLALLGNVPYTSPD